MLDAGIAIGIVVEILFLLNCVGKKKIVTDSPTRICVGSCFGMRDCPKKSVLKKIERIWLFEESLFYYAKTSDTLFAASSKVIAE